LVVQVREEADGAGHRWLLVGAVGFEAARPELGWSARSVRRRWRLRAAGRGWAALNPSGGTGWLRHAVWV
jgi:hypothetical protein